MDLVRATALLREAGVGSPRHDAEALLAHVLETPRLRARMVSELTAEQARRFAELVGRRAAREPLQHLLGVASFRRVELAVGPGVFVPRPETEVVAGRAIEEAQERGGAPVVVDLGTGSGSIALSVATEVPTSQVYAVELDPDAYAWAKRNLAGTAVTLRLGDAAEAFAELDGTVDVVVANPPYIPLDAYESVEAEARDHDPGLALWSGADGLDAIRLVERVAARLLRPDGLVVCEHADAQGLDAPGVFGSAGRWQDVRDHPDLAGRPRFVTARRAGARLRSRS